jgi:V/A-type H+-transporting ATPase subunit B
MKDGIGKEYTRENHSKISDQIFASYSKVQDVRALAKVLGEGDLSELDKKYLEFGEAFESNFINQNKEERRDVQKTLDLALEILNILPKEELSRM